MTFHETVTKLDAATRQLQSAALLYFQGGDTVSIHTLAAAGHEVVADLLSRQEGTTALRRSVLALSGEDVNLRRELESHLRHPQNFFKHANRESGGSSVVFAPTLSEYLLFDAAVHLRLLTDTTSPILAAFIRWFEISHPEVVDRLEAPDESLLHARRSWPVTERHAFLEKFIEAWPRIRNKQPAPD